MPCFGGAAGCICLSLQVYVPAHVPLQAVACVGEVGHCNIVSLLSWLDGRRVGRLGGMGGCGGVRRGLGSVNVTKLAQRHGESMAVCALVALVTA